MFVNAKQFSDTSKHLRVFNTNPYIVRALDIFFITENVALADALLTPSENGARAKLTIDGEEYPLQYGMAGEGPNNPIIYKKALAVSKVKFTDRDPRVTEAITGIVGTSSIIAGEWIVGTNINELNDSVLISLSVNDLPDVILQDNKAIVQKLDNGHYAIDGATLVVDVSQSMKYNYLYRTDTVSLIGFSDNMGWGESSYGGILDGGVESFGGIATTN